MLNFHADLMNNFLNRSSKKVNSKLNHNLFQKWIFQFEWNISTYSKSFYNFSCIFLKYF